MDFHFLKLEHHFETYGLITMILCNVGSVPQLCRNRLEDVNNLSYAILFLIVVRVYEFHRKPEKLKETKL